VEEIKIITAVVTLALGASFIYYSAFYIPLNRTRKKLNLTLY